MAASGDHATAVGLFSAIVMGLYRRERTGKGSYVTTSLLAEGVWAAGVGIAGALAGGTFYPLHDRQSPSNATLNPYKASDGSWFMLVVTPDKFPALATGIGRPDLVADPRFSDPAKQATNAAQLRAILDDVFAEEPMQHWRQVFDKAHITYGAILDPTEVVNDPQLRANNIVVPLEGAGGKLTLTISSPMQMHGVAKEPARRAPGLGEHNDEILKQLGFDAAQIEKLHAGGTVPTAKVRAA
jgi:crotonobetainyl-CoA:carnitine CoA-transferase CaiB-like acyl-CoA transferase